MSVVADLLGAIIGVLPVDEVTRADLVARLASVGSDTLDQSSLDQSLVNHETVEDGVTAPAFTVIRPSIKSIFVAWTGVGAVSGHGYYELQISTTASEAGLLDTRQTASTWTIFDALAANPATTYYFRIRAIDAAGHVGDWSAFTSQATNPQLESSEGELLQSSNFVAGSAGWQIKGNGDAEFNDVTVRGDLIVGDTSGYRFEIFEVATDTPVFRIYDQSADNVWDLSASDVTDQVLLYIGLDNASYELWIAQGDVKIEENLDVVGNMTQNGTDVSLSGHAHSGTTGSGGGGSTSSDDGSVGAHTHTVSSHTHSVSL